MTHPPVPSSRARSYAFGETPPLRDLTTFGVGGPVAGYLQAESVEEFIGIIWDADSANAPLLVLGGGSNLLASDVGFDGLVVRDVHADISFDKSEQDGMVVVTASAGTPWDVLVTETLGAGLSGLEALSGIPGTAGAAPVQNVGAYGHEVSETLRSVRAWDRAENRLVELAPEDMGLAYRTSIIKQSIGTPRPDGRGVWGPTGRWVVVDVSFELDHSPESAPVMYSELARRLETEVGGRVPAGLVRDTVLDLRRGKGMLLDDTDRDTWSAGSFFTNPILPEHAAEAVLPPDAPRFPAGDAAGPGMIKASAAWLIANSGFPKGYRISDDARASLSTKHVLALTNRGNATAADVEALARRVREGVREEFGVELHPEPVTVGIDL